MERSTSARRRAMQQPSFDNLPHAGHTLGPELDLDHQDIMDPRAFVALVIRAQALLRFLHQVHKPGLEPRRGFPSLRNLQSCPATRKIGFTGCRNH